MENVSKALQIAGGVLLAVIILSLVVFGFKQFGILPQQEYESMSAEQLEKFNKEYTVYNKSQMYGVDVISCLNKVQNYNEKFVLEAGKQLNGDGFYVGTNKYGSEFQIDIGLRIKTPLKEWVVIHKIDKNTGKSAEMYAGADIEDDRNFKDIFDVENYKYTGYSDKTLKYIIKNENYKEHILDNNMEANTVYRLYGNNDNLKNLISYKKDLKQIKKNDKVKTDVTDWSDATWYTALYDLKTRQFRCEYMEYNTDTGQVNRIYFSEIGLSPLPLSDWE